MSFPSDLAGWMPTGPNPVVDACVDERLVSVFFGGGWVWHLSGRVYLFLCQPNGWVDTQVMWGSRWESGAVPQP